MSSSPSPAQIIRYGRDDAGNRTSKSMLLQRTVEEGEDREVSFCAQPLELRTDMPRVVRSIQWNPDQTASVGDIPMNTGVLPNGMVTVQVPLVSGSSEGINPDISLVYGSYSGRGDAGYGWSISRISRITLSDRSVFYHGAASGAVAGDDDQVFSLDGVPLVRNTLVHESEYKLITADGNTLVQAHLNADNYPLYFTAAFADGSTAVYGYQGNTSVQRDFPVTMRTDRFGNQVEYGYSRSASDYYITSVVHSGGSMSFEYMTDLTSEAGYRAGLDRYKKRILQGVTVLNSSDEILLSYALNYAEEAGAYLLKGISVENSGGDHLNPLEFSYHTENVHTPAELSLGSGYLRTLMFTGSHRKLYSTGKYYPDSYSDGFINYPEFAKYGYKLFSYGSMYPENQRILVATSVEDSYLCHSDTTLVTGSGFQQFDSVDIDGDGVDELVKINYRTAHENSTSFDIGVYRVENNNIVLARSVIVEIEKSHPTLIPITYSPVQCRYDYGDFKGLGYNQLLITPYTVDKYDHDIGLVCPVIVNLRDGNYTTLSSPSPLLTYEEDEHQNFFCADIDGDGITELVKSNSSGTEVYRYEESSSNHWFWTQNVSTTFTGVPANCVRYLSDMNGDGYLDIIVSPVVSDESSASSVWTIYYYKGNGFSSPVSDLFTTYQEGDQYIFKDIDGDGYPDALRLRGRELRLYVSNHGSFEESEEYSCLLPEDEDERTLFSCDPSGRDYKYKALVARGFYVNSIEFSRDNGAGRMLYGVTSSSGVSTYYEYEDLRSDASHYEHTAEAPSLRPDYIRRTFGLRPVVEKSTVHDRNGERETIESAKYYYRNAVLHSLGLGFCGFTGITEINELDGITTERSYAPDRRSALLSSLSYRTDDPSKKIQEQSLSYLDRSTSYGQTRPCLRTTSSWNYLEGTYSQTDSIRYDASYDLVTWSRSLTGYIGASTYARKEQKTATYRDPASESPYMVGQLSSETSTITSPILEGQLRETNSYTYNAGNLPILVTMTRRDEFFNSVVLQKDSLYYDTHGNVVRRANSNYASAGWLSQSQSYDGAGRRLLSDTDALGQTTAYSNFSRWGHPQTATDYRGRQSSMSYDAWGNQVGSTAIDGTTSATSTSWGGEGLYKVTSSASGSPSVITHYNDLGQEILVEQQRFDGSWIKIRKDYDNRGRLVSETLPFKDDASELLRYTQYQYDEYGRPTRVVSASGGVKSWTYIDALTTEQREDGISRTISLNPETLVQSVSDGELVSEITPTLDGQTASMVVYPVGNPSLELSRTEYDYDIYGRLVSEDNTYTGHKAYSYLSVAGHWAIVQETNANGTITTKTDPYGRLLSVSRTGEGGYTSTYSYNSYNLLTSVSNTASGETAAYNVESYTYDAYDRPSSITATNGLASSFTREYSYNANGQISSISYSSNLGNLGTEQRTYANGHLTSYRYVKPSARPALPTIIWSLQEENSHGQPTRATSGPLTREYGFEPSMLPASRKVRLTSDTSGNISFEAYMFNGSTGNLGFKTYPGRGVTRTYGYDSLNRLTRDSGYGNYSYNDAGDPQSSVRNGTMLYNSTGAPHMEKSVSNPADTSGVRIKDQTVVFSAYRRPVGVASDMTTTASFRYDQNGERGSMTTTKRVGIRTLSSTKYYSGGCYEAVPDLLNNREVLYLGGGYYSAPAVAVKERGAISIYHLVRDYQGSITHILDAEGNVVEHTEYDSWGLPRRTLADGTMLNGYKGDEVPLMLDRGWTGHEHLQWAGLINMNARLYDPFTGRFLSPDPVLQDPLNPQTYNPYNYCLNNPLKYTDESGEVFVIDDLILLAAVNYLTAAVLNYVGQVTVNTLTNDGTKKLKDILWNDVDFLDVAITGAVGAVCSVIPQISATTAFFSLIKNYGVMLSKTIGAFLTSYYDLRPVSDGGPFLTRVSVEEALLKTTVGLFMMNLTVNATNSVVKTLYDGMESLDRKILFEWMGASSTIFLKRAVGYDFKQPIPYIDNNAPLYVPPTSWDDSWEMPLWNPKD